MLCISNASSAHNRTIPGPRCFWPRNLPYVSGRLAPCHQTRQHRRLQTCKFDETKKAVEFEMGFTAIHIFHSKSTVVSFMAWMAHTKMWIESSQLVYRILMNSLYKTGAIAISLVWKLDEMNSHKQCSKTLFLTD